MCVCGLYCRAGYHIILGDMLMCVQVEHDDEPNRKSLEQPPSILSSSSPQSSSSSPSSSNMVHSPDTPPKGKERYRVSVSYRDQVQKICWYGEDTPSKTIEDVIRTAFGLPHHATLLLKNADDDIVAVSSSLPPNELFTLHVSNARREEGEDEPMVEEVIEKVVKHEKEEDESEEEGSTEGSPSPSPHSSPSPAIVSVQSREDTPSPIAFKVFILHVYIHTHKHIFTYESLDSCWFRVSIFSLLSFN